MTNLALSLFICNIFLIYFYSISHIFKKFLKFEINKIDQIIIGYSILLIFLYLIYFFFKFELNTIKIFLIISTIIIFPNLKSFIFKLFFTKKIIILNILLITILLPAIIFGEQFYIFRGNYWDSSNYLSSAVLMKNYDYQTILNQNYSEIYHQFRDMNVIISGRPLVNFFLSIFLNFELSLFYSYYFFKCFISILIYLSILSIMYEFKFLEKYNNNILVSIAFIFSFWNFYVFEIDALSHYASIPILIILTKFIFKKIDNDLKKKYVCLTLLSSSLFLIYPEIIFIPIIFFFIDFLAEIKEKNKKEFTILFVSITFFLLLTIPSLKTNYEYLFIKQMSQALRSNEWWAYFGSFILGKDNLVTNTDFVNLLKTKISLVSNIETLKIIHNAHFENKYYFIYLNILPSILGLYHLLPGKIYSISFFILNFIFLIFLIFYLMRIVFHNFVYFTYNNKIKKKFFYIISIILILCVYFISADNIWSSIKLYTYLFPFIFIIISINFKKKKVNHIYIFLVLTFFLYKFSNFNNGIGNLDSFPSILNPKIKSNIEWQLPKNIKENNCKIIYLNTDDYIIQAYLNLMLINDKKFYKKNTKICNVKIKNKKFILYDK